MIYCDFKIEQYRCDVQTVKSKVKNLRTAFRRLLSHIWKEWFCYELHKFLGGVEIARPGSFSQVDNCWVEMPPHCRPSLHGHGFNHSILVHYWRKFLEFLKSSSVLQLGKETIISHTCEKLQYILLTTEFLLKQWNTACCMQHCNSQHSTQHATSYSAVTCCRSIQHDVESSFQQFCWKLY